MAAGFAADFVIGLAGAFAIGLAGAFATGFAAVFATVLAGDFATGFTATLATGLLTFLAIGLAATFCTDLLGTGLDGGTGLLGLAAGLVFLAGVFTGFFIAFAIESSNNRVAWCSLSATRYSHFTDTTGNTKKRVLGGHPTLPHAHKPSTGKQTDHSYACPARAHKMSGTTLENALTCRALNFKGPKL